MKKEIYSAPSLPEADIVKSLLESKGIHCSIWDENIGTSYPPVTFSSGIRLVVDEKEYEEAKKIIDEYQREEEKEE